MRRGLLGGRPRALPALFCQQIDELNALQINLLELVSHWDQRIFNLYSRTVGKSFTAKDGSVGTTVIHKKECDSVFGKFLFSKGNASSADLKDGTVPACFRFDLTSKCPTLAFH